MRKAHFNLLYTEGAEQVRSTRLRILRYKIPPAKRHGAKSCFTDFGILNFKACGLGYHRKDLRAARHLKI